MRNIAVIIPCYNSERYIAETINSVRAQTYDNWECVVVDDGSTDNSAKIVDELVKDDDRFVVIHTENRGVALARNFGISITDAPYILPLDADDRLMPIALERFAEFWSKNPTASLIVPRIKRFGEGLADVIQDRQWYGYLYLTAACTPTNSSSFRRSDWKRVGGYRENTMYEDWEFWLRLLWHNDRVINIPEVLVEYRVHPDSRWHEAVKNHDEEVEKIKKMNPNIFKKWR